MKKFVSPRFEVTVWERPDVIVTSTPGAETPNALQFGSISGESKGVVIRLTDSSSLFD